ncbi:hypothetical protein [Caldilinea sp.]|uniref:hypothetical protein n=1 Tax=Caldilinea sp. TaxID=2293560 RepID=UPI0021DC5BE6|nr:hypothetical protein [Caldilinea sp.]GIV73501.1 MAG: hypothetical protein KatS3mg049_2057 [Caldilinea sp.]
MENELTKLRNKYMDLEARIRALQDANDARRRQALEMQEEMEAAALAGDVEVMRERMADLKVLDEAYRQNLAKQRELSAQLVRTGEAIQVFYRRAQVGDVMVDWSVCVEWRAKVLRSDWGGRRYEDGKVCLVDRELCAPELSVLGDIIRGNVSLEGNRLRVLVNQYRGVCWGDLGGDTIVKALAPLLDKERSPLVQVQEFLESLAVLA